MVMSKVKYEQLRQQRMEENKRKLEDLHLPLLSKALQKASSPNPSPVLNPLSCISIISPFSCFLFGVFKLFNLNFVCKGHKGDIFFSYNLILFKMIVEEIETSHYSERTSPCKKIRPFCKQTCSSL